MNDLQARWWESLRHFGLLLGPAQVAGLGGEPLEALSAWRIDRLRREINRFEAKDTGPGELVAHVLETVCRLGGEGPGRWERGASVGTEWSHPMVTGEIRKPRHLWSSLHGGRLPVFIEDRDQRIGIHRGRKTVSDCVQWLRAADLPLALLTNGRQWRLLYAGLDFDAACEWELERWFEEGVPGPQLDAVRRLLAAELLSPTAAEADPPLVGHIHASRRGQSELSAELGERVREAVEDLVRSHGVALTQALDNGGLEASEADIYRAAVRMVMRLVVILFAESRDLLPRDNPVYTSAYGLQGLFEQLDRLAARPGAALNQRFGAWPRLLALFRLIHDGSHHEALELRAYGGELFRPGRPESPDPVRSATHLFETACYGSAQEVMPDAVVHRMLRRLTRTRLRVRQGRGSTWTVVPVDFGDLSSEYIGILYEGLLDYELRTAPADDPILFLAVGNEPALPLSRLEALEDRQVKELFEKLKDTSRASDDEEGAEDSEGDAEEVDEEPEEAEAAEAEEEEPAEDHDAAEEDARSDREQARARAEAWAYQAAKTAKLVPKPRGRQTPEKRQAYESKLESKARALIHRVVLPGEWYLVRWGGTRKGSGTFYTRPQIAIPLAHRTLRPLAYDPPPGPDGEPNPEAATTEWSPKPPEEILALKVCDPACGSGSFPLAALRFLTEALYASLFHHGRLADAQGKTLVDLLGTNPDPDSPDVNGDSLDAERLPCRPDDEAFEDLLKARLRRHVVERCLYAVDLDPLATELCKLALWVETMDRDLPFSFLDHKVKAGNSLVGCWFDRFQHYPALAFDREGGDKNHSNGAHFEKEAWTKAIKAFRGNTNNSYENTVRMDLYHVLDERPLFSEQVQTEASSVHDHALEALERLHQLPVHRTEDRAKLYREEFLEGESWRGLKEAFDLWCACWFWSAEHLDTAALPSRLAEPGAEALRIARRMAAKRRFFHWELEFPDVFSSPGSGFDAVIGNPPWDIAKPNSKEFFSNVDPLYRTYGKQEAIHNQTAYFTSDESTERAWLEYNADFKAQSNWVKNVAFPFGDPKDEELGGNRFAVCRGGRNVELHERWRNKRAASTGYADAEHPFHHQGSADINLYKLFLEVGHMLLREDGRLGFLIPSGLYSDHDTQALRVLFLDHCRWQWLFGFENREGIFNIHRSFKFNPVIVQKGGQTEAIRTAFMRRRLEDWEEAEEHATPYDRDRVGRFSPKSKAILEIQSQRDLEILETIYSNSVLLGDKGPDGWGIEYATEFHMTNDSKLFPPRPKWEEDGYRPDEYSRWLKGDWQPRTRLCPAPSGCKRVEIPEGIILSRDGEEWIPEEAVEDVALPLYEGRMIGQFDFSEKGWVRGKGRSAEWEEIPWEKKEICPQFLMSVDDYASTLQKQGPKKGQTKALRGLKLGFMDVSSGTNTRTMIAAVVFDRPCGNKVPILIPRARRGNVRGLTAFLNSLPYDWVLRQRHSGLSLNYFIVEESVLPRCPDLTSRVLWPLVQSLSETDVAWAPSWVRCRGPRNAWRASWAATKRERLALRCQLDAITFSLFGLDTHAVQWILRECDLPKDKIADGGALPRLNPKGFWRVDKDRDPELRHTILTLVAFHELQQRIEDHGGSRDAGITAFCSQNDGEGWMLPKELRLADYGLGHDDRADRPQPVASRLGPRFFDWQLEQEPVDSWRECELHARNLLGPDGFLDLMAEIEGKEPESDWRTAAEAAEPPPGYYGPGQHRLFPGDSTLFEDKLMIDPPKKKG